MHIAPESHKRAGPSSSAGTLPSGDTARKAGSFLEFPSRISTAMRSYFSPDSSSSQAMRNARVFWLQYSFIAALHYRKETVVAIKSFEIVSVPVSDQQRSKQFYRDVLGFDVLREDPMGPGQSWI